MRKSVMLGLLTLAACGQPGEYAADYAESDVTTQSEALTVSDDGMAAPADSKTAGEIPVSAPQIAYSYSFGYRLPAAQIPDAQQTHSAMCEQAGPQICRVINMERSGGEGEYAHGSLQMEVKADRARAFGKELSSSVEEFDGDPVSASISGEDLSKQIVDTEARLRSRRLLADRLTELLRTRSGTVAELVEAERAVSDVNAEIDQAESWLAEMKGRVAFSRMDLSYESSSPGSGSFSGPIRDAWNDIAMILGSSFAAVIIVIVAILPWALILALIIWLRRKFKASDRTFWGRKIAVAPPQDS